MLRLFFILLYIYPVFANTPSPEDQIRIIENFISPNVSKKIQQFYIKTQKNLSSSTDNQLSLVNISNPATQKMIQQISDQVLDLLSQIHPQKNFYLDHAGLYGRIVGNFCPYHSDNCYFSCPIHGEDQSFLRAHCKGKCPGSLFKPNHTYWREYTALIYLNDDFEGGEILFEDGPCNKLYKKIIPIQAQMLILAPNGSNFYHEVFPIRKGTRYSIHLWYTSDPKHRLNPI